MNMSHPYVNGLGKGESSLIHLFNAASNNWYYHRKQDFVPVSGHLTMGCDWGSCIALI